MPRTIALIYVIFGVTWVFFSDRLLVWLHLYMEIGRASCRERV